METRDVVIVGGGPAGLAAAVELYKKGIRNVLIVEREKTMGGILRQCIHDGFGLIRFGETLSGPEYAQEQSARVLQTAVPLRHSHRQDNNHPAVLLYNGYPFQKNVIPPHHHKCSFALHGFPVSQDSQGSSA